jgi:DNA-binding transcriptional LysR family regulator
MDLLAQMATFVRVVEGGSLSSAARARRLSLAAVSRQLRALEDDLGSSLVTRSTRRLRITDAGRAWYGHCVRILRDVDDARSSMHDEGRVVGRLVVSASIAMANEFVLPRLPDLVTRHPRLAIDLRIEDQLVDLVGEGIDVALRGGAPPPDTTSFVAHPLARFPRILVASPTYLGKRRLTKPEELARHRCLVQLATERLVPWTLRREDRDEAEITVDVRGPVRATTPLALRDLAISGLGIAYLPDWLVAPAIATRQLVRVLDGWASRPIASWAIHRTEHRGSPKIAALLGALVSARSRR